MKSSTQKERLYYAAGPGDVVTTFRHWTIGGEDPRQFARTYSAQFFDVVKRRNAEGWVFSTAENDERARGENIHVRNRPLPRLPWFGRQVVAAIRLAFDLVRIRPDAAIVAEGTTLWTLMLPLRWLGFRIVPTIHCVLRRPHAGRARRVFEAIENWSLRQLTSVCLSASAEIDAQLPDGLESRRFLPTYRRDRFAGLRSPAWSDKEIRLLYVGRVEADKGVFELLDAVRTLNEESHGRIFRLDVCGAGGAHEALRSETEKRGLNRVVSLNGHCSFDRLRDCLAASHVVVVPTTSRFVEGFNQVIVEGVLAGRPVVATSVCPSANLFNEGAVRVIEPDRADAIIEAVTSLVAEESRYDEARAAVESAASGSWFFSEMHSWAAQCAAVLNDSASVRPFTFEPVEIPS